MEMLMENFHTGSVLATRVEFATTFGARLKGLLGRPSLPPGASLVLHPCSSIHTFFMRFPIDVLFLNADFEVLAVMNNLPPYRISRIVKGARMVVELPAGTIIKTGTRAGHKITFDLRGDPHEI